MGKQTFSIRVNDGAEQTITTKTGIYQYAAAAVPAILDADLPITVEIWVPSLLPTYGPYFYRVENDEYSNVVVKHCIKS